MQEVLKSHIKNKTKFYSIDRGPVKVLSILKLYDGVEDYLEIKLIRDDLILCLPMSVYKNFRITSSYEDLTHFLTDLSNKVNNEFLLMGVNIDRKKSMKIDLTYIINTIAMLSNNHKITESEKKLLSLCLDSLVLEISDVFEVSEMNARGIVSDYTKCA